MHKSWHRLSIQLLLSNCYGATLDFVFPLLDFPCTPDSPNSSLDEAQRKPSPRWTSHTERQKILRLNQTNDPDNAINDDADADADDDDDDDDDDGGGGGGGGGGAGGVVVVTIIMVMMMIMLVALC